MCFRDSRQLSICLTLHAWWKFWSGYFGSLSTVFFSRWPNKLSHNCLYQEPHTCRLFVSLFCLMPESKGQKKLRLTKERLTNELRLRTVGRQAQLREEAINRLTDEDIKAKQCGEKAPCLYACLFCFWLLVVNLLLAQWFYFQGRLRLN